MLSLYPFVRRPDMQQTFIAFESMEGNWSSQTLNHGGRCYLQGGTLGCTHVYSPWLHIRCFFLERTSEQWWLVKHIDAVAWPWKSPKGGVNRRNLEITNLSTHYKTGLALERISSLGERGKQINWKTSEWIRWFVLPRFGSNEPSPRWGGHKDRVSFNPFPLSNGHLDRVSFLLNQMGHLDPARTTKNLVSLALITSVLRTRMRKKKVIQEQELKEHEQKLSL
jgi:hypothetical protein